MKITSEVQRKRHDEVTGMLYRSLLMQCSVEMIQSVMDDAYIEKKKGGTGRRDGVGSEVRALWSMDGRSIITLLTGRRAASRNRTGKPEPVGLGKFWVKKQKTKPGCGEAERTVVLRLSRHI